jgi:hypothetical protein
LLAFGVSGSSVVTVDDSDQVPLIDRASGRKIRWRRGGLPRCCTHAAGIGGGRVLIVGSFDLR